MQRDPLYQQIVEQLERGVSDDLFEACAQALLRKDYPTLVPVRGGDDAGFDGAIGTLDGRWSLIVTTAKDVIGNVRKNLNEIRRHGASGPNRAVIGTSQCLTPRRQRNIQEAAKALGFEVVHIHEQTDFANRLYDNPRWRMELLGLSGYPPALSPRPVRSRSDRELPLIGRADALAQIEAAIAAQQDLLLVGQPGSGKTYLHEHLARMNRCLFVVDSDIARIADALRQSPPPCVVIDDAHLRCEFITELRRLRAELGKPFAIHANCWPSYESVCKSMMRPTNPTVLHLQLLTRIEIVRVLRECGIVGPDNLVNMLLDQAVGKPGLAVALAEVCKRGGVKEVWTGESLAEYLLDGNGYGRGTVVRSVLAGFAIGGDAGMSLEAVANGLNMNPHDVLERVTGLASGGMIEETPAKRYAVCSPMQGLLVAEVFFSGAASLPSDSLIAVAPSKSALAHVLCSARQREGLVPLQQIDAAIKDCPDPEVWQAFSFTDSDAASHILKTHSKEVVSAASGLLHFKPSETLRALFDAAAQERFPDGAKQIRASITDWIRGSNVEDSNHLVRRRLLLREVKRWAVGKPLEQLGIVAWTYAEILSPTFGYSSQQPGNGRTFSMVSGTYSKKDVRAIAALWSDLLDGLKALPPRIWKPITTAVEGWCCPGLILRSGDKSADDLRDVLKKNGLEMLHDIASLPQASRAIRSWIARVMQVAKTKAIETDADYETMFGERNRNLSWQEADKQRMQELKALAVRLSKDDPRSAWKYLEAIEAEASEWNVNGGWSRSALYHELATITSSPNVWVDVMMRSGANASHVFYFLEKLVATSRIEGQTVLQAAIADNGQYSFVAVAIALGLEPLADADILESCIKWLNQHPQADPYWLYHLKVPISTRIRLLRDGSSSTKATTALAEWMREPKGKVLLELNDVWRSAVLEATDEDEYHLKEILKTDAILASAWILRRLASDDYWPLQRYGEIVKEVVGIMSLEQRRTILFAVTLKSFNKHSFACVLADDVALFGEWLDQCPDEHLRLLPLRGPPSDRWVALARVALDHGVTPEQIAESSEPRPRGGGGPMSVHYAALLKQYEALLNDQDARLHLAAQRGSEACRAELEQYLADERDEEVYGLGQARRRRRIPL